MGVKLVMIDLAGEQITKVRVLENGGFRTADPNEYPDLLTPAPLDHLRSTELPDTNDRSSLSADQKGA